MGDGGRTCESQTDPNGHPPTCLSYTPSVLAGAWEDEASNASAEKPERGSFVTSHGAPVAREAFVRLVARASSARVAHGLCLAGHPTAGLSAQALVPKAPRASVGVRYAALLWVPRPEKETPRGVTCKPCPIELDPRLWRTET